MPMPSVVLGAVAFDSTTLIGVTTNSCAFEPCEFGGRAQMIASRRLLGVSKYDTTALPELRVDL
jgi:hypothetical protein